MKTKEWTIDALMRSFFGEYLTIHRKLSPNTVAGYRDAWVLFLRFLRERRGKAPSVLRVADLDADDLLAFLDHIERERGNGAQTRNARLAAIRCAVKYALMIDPTLPPAVHRIELIPLKRTTRRAVDFLEQPEVDALMAAPDAESWCGRRDQVMVETMYNTGARVSEMTASRVCDVRLVEAGGQIHLHGKGRKERTLPLWSSTVKRLRDWIRLAGLSAENPLFPSKRGGGPMTRSAVEKRLRRAVGTACHGQPSLSRLRVSPHTLRHTTAMHLHDSGADMAELAIWLGHESIETTGIYLSASMERKEKTLKRLKPPETKSFRYRGEDQTMTYLDSI